MAPKRGLGKGLDSLIPNSVLKPVAQEKTTEDNKEKTPIINKEEKESEKIVKISKIEPNRNQPRKNFNEESLNELAESIKKVGVISPILVQEKDDRYIIIDLDKIYHLGH